VCSKQSQSIEAIEKPYFFAICRDSPLAFKAPYLPDYALRGRHRLPTSLREKPKREKLRQVIETKKRRRGSNPGRPGRRHFGVRPNKYGDAPADGTGCEGKQLIRRASAATSSRPISPLKMWGGWHRRLRSIVLCSLTCCRFKRPAWRRDHRRLLHRRCTEIFSGEIIVGRDQMRL
jgi:hypothetical protein